jgi:hypothetical protein
LKVVTLASGFGLSLSLAVALLASKPVFAQKILRIERTPDGIIVNNAADDASVRVTRGKVIHRKFLRIARPYNTLFQPYYRFPRPYANGPDLTSRIRGGRTVEGGSRWASRIAAGRTVERGSPFASKIPIWRFSRSSASAR